MPKSSIEGRQKVSHITHHQCIYPSETDVCERCTNRGLKCIKVWGPKRRGLQDDVEIRKGPEKALAIMPSHLSLLKDSELSSTDLFYLRSLHRDHQGVRNAGCVTGVLQNLWRAYSSTFAGADHTLLYSAVAYACRRFWTNDGEWMPQGQDLYWGFISRFHKSLSTAIQAKQVTESHLFAIFLALQSDPNNRDFEVTHEKGFLDVLKAVTTNNQSSAVASRCRLPHLYNYLLSFIRRWQMWEAADTTENIPLLWKLHEIARNLSTTAHALDSRSTDELPTLSWPASGADSPWLELACTVRDVGATVSLCFQQLFCRDQRAVDLGDPSAQCLASVEKKLTEMLHFPCVAELLHPVSSHR